MADARADVGLDALGRRLPDVLHEVPVVRALVDACGAAEVVERDRDEAALGEAEGELLVEAIEAADVREDHDPDLGGPVGHRTERREAVAVLRFEHEVVVRDGGACDARDRRLGVELEAHRARSLREEAHPLRRTSGAWTRSPSARR
jgi:hypothetical protein